MSETQSVDTTPTEPSPAETGSLADHEKQFGRFGQEPATETVQEPTTPQEATDEPPAEESAEAKEARARDEQGRFTKPPKHRAEKDKARPEDVPRIQELTRKNRELAEKLARWERYEQEQRAVAPTPQPVAAKPALFTESEPTLDQFDKEEDPYGAYLKAWARWDRRKESFEADQAKQKEQAQHAEAATVQQAQAEYERAMTGYQERLAPFRESHPDFDELMADHAAFELTPLAQATILLHERGPEVVYYLLQHPEVLDEVHLLTDGKPITEQNVAMATRWLDRRRQPVQETGSGAPARQIKPPPPPPNPVRTVPNRADAPPSDDSSLAEHERAYGRRRR